MERTFTLNVNGQTHQVTAEPDTPLLTILRNDLGLTGAKFGCGLGQCGACKVIVDGRAIPSCQLSVRAAQGRTITTVEGLGTPDDLHPIQEAFLLEGAVQCGYCTPGMIVAAAALLARNPNPSDAEIRAELAGNLCRCGTHERVLRAVRRVAGRPPDARQYQVEVHRGQSAPPVGVSPSFLANPELDSWVRVETDGTITLFTGKVELGQDLRTSIAMLGAEELDVPLDRIRVSMADTGRSPDEGYTVSSMSLETSGNAIRAAAAEVRQLALSVAHEELEAPIERLKIADGTISDPATGRSVTYWDLFAGRRFGLPVRGVGQPKPSDAHRIVGHPTPRVDLLARVTGQARFVHDMALPGMVHGRVVRPPQYDARLVSVDAEVAARLPGVLQVVRDGSFLGVIAEREEQAVRAAETLSASAMWEEGAALPDQEALFEEMVNRPDLPFLVVDGTAIEGHAIPPIEPPAGAAKTIAAIYSRPYHAHASLGPSAAVAQFLEGELIVWTHAQGPYPLRAALAQALDMQPDAIRAIHVDGPGCYGHNGADDAALDAALLARAVPGRPVSLTWTRADECAWEPYGPATVIRMEASINDQGAVVDWNHDVTSYAHSSRPHGGGRTASLVAAWHLDRPFEPTQPRPMLGRQSGAHRNADPLYTFPRRRVVKHFLPDSPLRVSALRGLGSYANVFALESFVDELAHAAGADPVAFRLRHLADERARAVIEAAADRAGWRAGEQLPGADRGRGIAFAQYKNRQGYVAVVVELHVQRPSGRIGLDRAVIAADAGQIVNPDGLSNQLEGACIQAASWTIEEQVSFDAHGITSLDWLSYPILRFPDAPRIEVVLLDRPDDPFLGIGEGAQGPVPAAIANAVFDAVGVRLRSIPFRPAHVRAALQAV